MSSSGLLPYDASLAGTLLAAREAVMAPIRPVLRESNVTEQQWRVLRVLCDSGSTEPTRLAQIALLHAPSVTRILRELLDRKLVTRQTDAKDGRRALIKITPKGRELIIHTAQHTRKMLDEYDVRFGAERLAFLREELQALTEALADCAPQEE